MLRSAALNGGKRGTARRGTEKGAAPNKVCPRTMYLQSSLRPTHRCHACSSEPAAYEDKHQNQEGHSAHCPRPCLPGLPWARGSAASSYTIVRVVVESVECSSDDLRSSAVCPRDFLRPRERPASVLLGALERSAGAAEERMLDLIWCQLI